MQFEVRHSFPRDPATSWRELMSPAYEEEVNRRSGVQRELLSDRAIGSGRELRYRMQGHPLPAPVRALLGGKDLSYEVIESHDPARKRYDWRVIPSAMAEKITAEGTWELLPTASGCERLVKGTIRVAIPLVGSKIEAALAQELKRSYEDSVDFAKSWLETHT